MDKNTEVEVEVTEATPDTAEAVNSELLAEETISLKTEEIVIEEKEEIFDTESVLAEMDDLLSRMGKAPGVDMLGELVIKLKKTL